MRRPRPRHKRVNQGQGKALQAAPPATAGPFGYLGKPTGRPGLEPDPDRVAPGRSPRTEKRGLTAACGPGWVSLGQAASG
jgi:hypothetical protein